MGGPNNCAPECFDKCQDSNVIDQECLCTYYDTNTDNCKGVANYSQATDCSPIKWMGTLKGEDPVPSFAGCVKEDKLGKEVLVFNKDNRDYIITHDNYCYPDGPDKSYLTRVNMGKVTEKYGKCSEKKLVKDPKAASIKFLKEHNIEVGKKVIIDNIDMGDCIGYALSEDDKDLKMSFEKNLIDLTSKEQEKIKITLTKDFENFIPGKKVKEVKLIKGSTEAIISFVDKDDSNNLFRIILIILFIFIAFMIISSPSSKTRSNNIRNIKDF